MLVLQVLLRQLTVSSLQFTLTSTFQFPVQAVPDANSIVVNVGVSNTDYLYVSGGTAFVGVTTTVYPDKVSKSYFEVLQVIDANTIRTNVGISTINHTYVRGGHLTDLTPLF